MVLSFSWIKKHNIWIKRALDGKAVIIIDDGKIFIDKCKKVGLSAHDVSFKLRSNNIYSVKKVKRAIIEQNGQMIVIQHGEENPKFPLITDGLLHDDILKIIGKDKNWLKNEIKSRGYKSISKIYLAEYDSGEINIIPY